MATPLWIPGVGPIWSPATGGPVAVVPNVPCECCEAGTGPVMGYRICPCCVTQEECDEQPAVYVRPVNFPGGPGIYKHESGACFKVIGPAVDLGAILPLDTRGTGPFATCEECNEECNCAEPTQLALSLTGWETRDGPLEVSSLGSRFWYEVSSANPMSGSYIIPANHSSLDPEIVLRTMTDAVIATGPFGEFGRCDLQLFLTESSVQRCVSREPGTNLCKWKWRLSATVGVRYINETTTDNRAVVGPTWPLTYNFPGYAPFAQLFGVDEEAPCNEGVVRCYTAADDPEAGPDGGCAAWTNWPGCPATPRLYRSHRAGCVNLEAA